MIRCYFKRLKSEWVKNARSPHDITQKPSITDSLNFPKIDRFEKKIAEIQEMLDRISDKRTLKEIRKLSFSNK